MPEPVSLISLAGFAALNGYARRGSAVSSEARAARKTATALVESVERSQSLFGDKTAALSRLGALLHDCAGVDEGGINVLAAYNAAQVVRALPDRAPMPEFSIEPDGCVSLDWIRSRKHMFSLSVSASQRLAYAWLDGADKGHGVASFDGETIPKKVIEGIRGIMDHGDAAFRAI